MTELELLIVCGIILFISCIPTLLILICFFRLMKFLKLGIEFFDRVNKYGIDFQEDE